MKIPRRDWPELVSTAIFILIVLFVMAMCQASMYQAYGR